MAAIMVTTLIAGMFLVLPARLKLGNLVRYIPSPVTGGFFAGIGYIFVEGGLTVASSREPTFSAFSETEFVRLITPAVLLALCLIIEKMFRDNRFAVPGILLLSIVIFYGVLIFSGVSPEEAAANGLLPVIESSGSLLPVFPLDYVQEIRWTLILQQIGGILVVS
ncbi:MAG: SulP family inorganic anion transporter, partial [Gammaproteobacteria bacterium]|nr:SulP family inorganic anion transporter [Gammaproteobacteria bacterium]